ncbi:MAG: SusC/RagA family TonB-linked outer membrane protein [Bacteroidota bacterium]
MNYIKKWIVLCVAFVGICSLSFAQKDGAVSITSMIQNEQGKPIAGALVSANDGKTTTVTNGQGQFSIFAMPNSNIIVEAKGYKTKTFQALDIPASIRLESDNSGGEVYVAFDKVTRKSLPGAISVINPEDFIDYDYNLSVDGGMNGRLAGLLWSNNVWGMENAMVLIDGISREYSDITLNEVQQITVLKGVNAVALYGSQAAKGAILITTKKGEANKRKIAVRVNSGISLPRALPKYLNSADYMELYNEGRRNDGLTDLYSAATIQNYRTGNPYRYPSVDFFSSEYLKKHLNATDANAEFSGGNANARFYSNIGYYNSSTLMKVGEGNNEGDNRLSVRGNIDLKLNEKITSSIYVSAIFSDSRRARSSAANTNFWSNAATLLPNRVTPLIPVNLISPTNKTVLSIVDASRNVIGGKYLLGGAQQFLSNAAADLYSAGYDVNIRRVFQVTNQINADLGSVLKGLSFHTLFNLDYSNSYLQSSNNTYAVYAPTWSATGDTITGLQKFGDDSRPGTQNINTTTQRQNLGFSTWLGYNGSFGKDHLISAKLLGYTMGVAVNDVYQRITNSHLGLQLAYSFKQKFSADFSSAYVNSTKLPTGNRTAFSPTLSLGWLISNEAFLARTKAINYLKLSASAGILNTDLDISQYYLYDNIYTRQGSFTWNDGVQGQNQATTSSFGASPNLTFPKRKEINVGLEGAFFNNLLTVQATFFKQKMEGLATQRFSLYPNYFSTFIPYTNYNSQQRSGFDLMLNVNKNFGDLQVSLGTTATYSTSKVTQRDELFVDAYQNRAGKPVDAIFGLVSSGLFQSAADITNSPRQLFSEVRPGDVKYVDQNKDNVIDSRDEVMIGRFVAPFTYGLNLRLTYKRIDLFILGTGTQGGYGITNNNYYWVSGDLKYSEVVRNRWTPTTAATATYPRLSSQQSANNFRSSSFWLFKSDRFNLNKVQLSYSLSPSVVRKTLFKDLGIYIAGSNLFTFSENRDILDLSIASTPQFRNYIAGIRARF